MATSATWHIFALMDQLICCAPFDCSMFLVFELLVARATVLKIVPRIPACGASRPSMDESEQRAIRLAESG